MARKNGTTTHHTETQTETTASSDSHEGAATASAAEYSGEKTESVPSHNTETGETSAPPQIERIELIGKIVAKDIVSKKELKYKRIEGKDDETDYPSRDLYRVFGTAEGTTSGESSYGTWTAFLGSFEVIRFSDRKQYRSAKLFLQGAAEPLLINALAQARKVDPNAKVVFCFDIGVKVSARWLETEEGNSYEYTVASVFKTETADPLAALRGSAMQALPAPVTAAIPSASVES